MESEIRAIIMPLVENLIKRCLISFLSGYLSFGMIEKTHQECYEIEVSEAIRLVAEETVALGRAWEEDQQEYYDHKLPHCETVRRKREDVDYRGGW